MEDAEELTQEVFLRIVRSVGGYEDREKEKAWVFRIARNVWLDRLRSRQRDPPCQELEGHDLESGASQVTRIALDQALDSLAEPEREAFLLREAGGLGYAEIAEVTGTSPGAVRNRIHRARLALRQHLREEAGTGNRPRGEGRGHG